MQVPHTLELRKLFSFFDTETDPQYKSKRGGHFFVEKEKLICYLIFSEF